VSTFEITIRAGSISLENRNVREVLVRLAAESGLRFVLTDEGTIAVARELSPLDRRALALDLVPGKRSLALRSDASMAPVVAWLGARLARLLDAVVEAAEPVPASRVHALLEAHEAPFLEADDKRGPGPDDEDVKAVLALVRLGRLLIAEGAEPQLLALVEAHSKAELLYEALLESDFVDDVFLSQSEFVAALR